MNNIARKCMKNMQKYAQLVKNKRDYSQIGTSA